MVQIGRSLLVLLPIWQDEAMLVLLGRNKIRLVSVLTLESMLLDRWYLDETVVTNCHRLDRTEKSDVNARHYQIQ